MRPIYNLSYRRLVVLLLPMLLRKSLVVAFLRAMVTPVSILQGDFNFFRRQTAYDLSINGQVCFLEKMLNDNFDDYDRRIYIDDANSFQRLFIYTREENNPIKLYTREENKPIYLFNPEDFADGGFDFYIVLNGVILTEQQLVYMRILTDKYKIVTKKYKIT